MPTTYRCRSKVVPCPAGDRCPEHRGLISALNQAVAKTDYTSFEDLMEKDAKAKIKRNRKGETVVSFVTGGAQTKRQVGSIEFSLTKPHKQVVNLGVLTSADVVDKDRVVYFDVYDQADITAKIQETYGTGVNVQVKNVGMQETAITGLELPAGFAEKGVAKHLLESIIANSREDLYNFGTDIDVPYSTLAELGFQPNPYYWAGKTHEPTGVTYPSVEKLEKKLKHPRRKRVTQPDGTSRMESQDGNRYWFRGLLYTGRDLAQFPYIRRNPINTTRWEDFDFNSNANPTQAEKDAYYAAIEQRVATWDARRKEIKGWGKPRQRVSVA